MAHITHITKKDI